ANSPHMSGFKRMLQRLGSWTVSLASGIDVADVTSGFRAFSREAAMRINVFNPFTYTLETIIQSGNHNLGVQSVAVRTNAPTRPSRLYRGIGTYLRKSVATIFRISTVYRPLKTFAWLGFALVFAGVLLGMRFVWAFFYGNRAGHVQSLILCAVFLVTGFQTWLIALVADLIAVNRRISEDVLLRLKRMEMAQEQRRPRRDRDRDRDRDREREQRPRPQPAVAPPPPKEPETQWVWLHEPEQAEEIPAVEESPAPGGAPSGGRRRRRRRGGPRNHP